MYQASMITTPPTTPSKCNTPMVDLTGDDSTISPTAASFTRCSNQTRPIDATSIFSGQETRQLFPEPNLFRDVTTSSIPAGLRKRSRGVSPESPRTPTATPALKSGPLSRKVRRYAQEAPGQSTAIFLDCEEETDYLQRQRTKNAEGLDEFSLLEASNLSDDNLPVSNVAAHLACVNLVDDDEYGATAQSVPPLPDRRFTFTIQQPVFNLLSSAGDTTLNRKVGDIGTLYKPGDAIEFVDGSFMRIKRLIKGDFGQPDNLLGQLFKRLDDSNDQAPKDRINEIVWTAAPPLQHPRGYVQIPLVPTNILRNRTIILSNQRYLPNSAVRPEKNTIPDVNGLSALYCRWKLTQLMEDGRLIEEAWTALTPVESDPATRISREDLRGIWRGIDTISGGADVRHTTVREYYDVERQVTFLDLYAKKTTVQSYTFGDAFCGAGGTSWGAHAAGLRVQWAFDLDQQACETYRLNQPQADCRNLGVDQFIAAGMVEDFKVDILHLSPPCQPYSPANTTPNILRNEANQAPLFAIPQLLDIAKPRVVTLEETEGIQNRHSQWFDALVRMFLEAGYSLRWRILWCRDYGVPQLRKRLVIVAAGPGEVLPPLPAPTHSRLERNTPGLPLTSHISKALSSIPRNASLMNTADIYDQPRVPHSQFGYAKTVTCSGGDNYHPSGLRTYHVRELAALQTFPYHFRFVGEPDKTGNIGLWRRQIGNAVPPKMAEAVYRCIIKTLKEVDGV